MREGGAMDLRREVFGWAAAEGPAAVRQGCVAVRWKKWEAAQRVPTG